MCLFLKSALLRHNQEYYNKSPNSADLNNLACFYFEFPHRYVAKQPAIC